MAYICPYSNNYFRNFHSEHNCSRTNHHEPVEDVQLFLDDHPLLQPNLAQRVDSMDNVVTMHGFRHEHLIPSMPLPPHGVPRYHHSSSNATWPHGNIYPALFRSDGYSERLTAAGNSTYCEGVQLYGVQQCNGIDHAVPDAKYKCFEFSEVGNPATVIITYPDGVVAAASDPVLKNIAAQCQDLIIVGMERRYNQTLLWVEQQNTWVLTSPNSSY